MPALRLHHPAARRHRALFLFLATLVMTGPALAQEAEEAAPASVRARFGEGVTFDTGDGQFSLTVRGRLQLRYVASGNSGAGGLGPISQGFFVRRGRLQVDGTFLQDFEYKLQLGMSPFDMESDNPNVLRDAQVTWTRFRDLQVRAGQGKVMYDRQRLNSSSALQFTDRSAVTSEFTLDRDVGVQLFSEDLLGLDGRLVYALGLHGGEGRNPTATGQGLLLSARVGYRPFGGFDDLSEADLSRSDAPRLGIYAGVARNWNAVRAQGSHGDRFFGGHADFTHLLLDGLFKWKGLSVSGALHLRSTDEPLREDSLLAIPTDTGWGVYGQVGYVFVPEWEVVARYGQIRGFRDRATGLEDLTEIGAGIGWYLMDQDLKLQASYLLNPAVAGAAVTRHQAHLQLQLFF
ncbi:MAG TPA: porin [Myxococcaceae bacterium]|nr:porin [Myxococcaceae bacterium]